MSQAQEVCFLLVIILMQKSNLDGNPIFTNFRTADASPQIWEDGRLWVYTSGDYDHATNYKHMDHYKCYSTEDMVIFGRIIEKGDF